MFDCTGLNDGRPTISLVEQINGFTVQIACCSMANENFHKFVSVRSDSSGQVGAHVTSVTAIAEYFHLFHLFREDLLQLLHGMKLEWEDVWYQI